MYLENRDADFEIIKHDTPISTVQDAKQYSNIDFAAPVFVVQSEKGIMVLITSAKRGKLDFKKISMEIGISKLKLANREIAEKETGYKIGSMPLIGSNLPCIFDKSLLNFKYIYGGSGDALHTLKIKPNDVEHLNNVVFSFN